MVALELGSLLGSYENWDEYQIGRTLIYLPQVEMALRTQTLTYANQILATLLEEQEKVILLAEAALQMKFPNLHCPLKNELLVYSIRIQPSAESADFEVNFIPEPDNLDPYHMYRYEMTVHRDLEGKLSLLN